MLQHKIKNGKNKRNKGQRELERWEMNSNKWVMGSKRLMVLRFLFSVFESAHNKEFNNNTGFHEAYHVYSTLSTIQN